LDSYCELKGLDVKPVINGICLDPRIGDYYNNPSFGYGGYCLPKDTKQLKASYDGIPNNVINAIVEANDTRKNHIADMIEKRLIEQEQKSTGGTSKTIGIYKLAMKANSDNARFSAILGIIERLQQKHIPVIIYDDSILTDTFNNCPVIHDFSRFIASSSLVIANRITNDLLPYRVKVYTRDVFGRD
jgi:UDPglucose 6-dehydrogenase